MLSRIVRWCSDLPWSRGSAAHASMGNQHSVVIEHMRVLMIPDGEYLWFAQGIDIDYAAGGNSIEDAQFSFEAGLAATLKAHLERFGTVEKVMRSPDLERWLPLATAHCQEFETPIRVDHAVKDTALSGILPYRTIAYYGCQRKAA